MGLIRRGGGGGGGDEQDGLGLGMDTDPKRCEVCRRELMPWESACPDDGGRAVSPDQIAADHDPLLARLLAEEATDADEADEADDGGAADDGTADDGGEVDGD